MRPARLRADVAGDDVNLFNMGFDVTLKELKELTQNKVTLVGNLPPRDVLAKADPAGVAKETKAMLDAIPDKSRLVVSCGGGMPPGVSTENVNAFIRAVREAK
jgi:uroporphyrinogen decarboxylase